MENLVDREVEGEMGDRLSTLPEPILISEVLSRLPIGDAAVTNSLSDHWRGLWTGVNRFVYIAQHEEYKDMLPILIQLTSPDLRVFDVDMKDVTIANYNSSFEDLRSCLNLVCNRGVEEIKVIIPSLGIPPRVFNCPTLICLDLECLCYDFLPENSFVHGIVHLPNLKKLRLFIDRLYLEMVETLVRSCPSLEDLFLVMDDISANQDVSILLFAPNLKFLNIDRRCVLGFHNVIRIHAPNLESLTIQDSFSVYCFVQNPTRLVTVYYDNMENQLMFDEFNDEILHDSWDQGVSYCQIAKFVRQLSSARRLCLKISLKMCFSFFEEDDGALIRVQGLTCFGTVLDRDYGWDRLLRFCHRLFPNLEELEVRFGTYSSMDPGNWCEPGMEAEYNLLFSKLKVITIRSLRVNDDEIKLLKYILDKATSLEGLHLSVTSFMHESPDGGLQNEYEFCEALLKLPKSSLVTKIVFEGDFFVASCNPIENGSWLSDILTKNRQSSIGDSDSDST